MKKHSYIHLVWLIVLVLPGCKEVYYPDDLSEGSIIPVIEGMIVEGQPPWVRISKTQSGNSNNVVYINNALVRISDDLGNEAVLTSKNEKGYYSPVDSSYRGIRGRTYSLNVRLSSGNQYEAIPQTIPETMVIDTLYASPGRRVLETYNVYHELVPKFQPGLFLKADVVSNTHEVHYCRFDTRALWEYECTIFPGTWKARPVFGWHLFSPGSFFNVNMSLAAGNFSIIREQNLGFLHYEYNPEDATESMTAPYPVCWIISLSVYSISKEVYDYYHTLQLQLEAGNQIFSPSPSRVPSTVYCITDPRLPVIGVFEASSCVSESMIFAWRGTDYYVSKRTSSFPDVLKDGFTINFPPSWWVYP